jgi:hypothetical protein
MEATDAIISINPKYVYPLRTFLCAALQWAQRTQHKDKQTASRLGVSEVA